MARAALFAALLLVGLASCSAFDLSEFPAEVLDFVKDKVILPTDAIMSQPLLQDWNGELGELGSAFGRRDGEEGFFLLKKMHVWPRLSCEFAKTLIELKDEMKETEGLKHYQVSKSLVDNHLFCVCEAWESKEAFLKYIKKEDTKGREAIKYIQEKDIRLQLAPVEHIAEAMGKGSKSRRMRDRSDGCNDEDPQCGSIVAIKFMVKPSELEEFKSCLQKFTEKAQDEDGLIMLKFAKTQLDDVLVVGYGEWESRKALESHLQQDYFQEFKEGVMKKNIVAFKEPLKVLTKVDTQE